MRANEKQRQEAEVEHALAPLLRISDKLNSIFDLDSLLDCLVEQVVELTSAEAGCAGLRTAEGMACDRFLQGTSIVPQTYCSRSASEWAGWVLAHGTYYVTNSASDDLVITPELRSRFSVKSGMSVPILDSNKDVIAFFEVYNKKASAEFTPQDLRNSTAAAKIASLAIQNGLTHTKLIALAAFSRSLTLASDLEQTLETVGQHLAINFQRASSILLPTADRGLLERYKTPGSKTTDKELGAATWCWENNQEAGASTGSGADAYAHYLPLTVAGQVSRAGESHPRALPEPYVNLSAHTAPSVRPLSIQKLPVSTQVR